MDNGTSYHPPVVHINVQFLYLLRRTFGSRLKMLKITIAFTILSAFSAVLIVAQMKCYQCNSQKESDCESSDAEVLKKYSKDCVVLKEGTYKGKEPIACRKLVQDIDSSRRVVRECAYTGDKNLDGMRKQGNKGVKVLFYQCQNTDQSTPCNGGTSLVFASTTVLTAIVSAIVFVMQH